MNAAPYRLRPLSKNLSGDGSQAERPVLYSGIKRWRGVAAMDHLFTI